MSKQETDIDNIFRLQLSEPREASRLSQYQFSADFQSDIKCLVLISQACRNLITLAARSNCFARLLRSPERKNLDYRKFVRFGSSHYSLSNHRLSD